MQLFFAYSIPRNTSGNNFQRHGNIIWRYLSGHCMSDTWSSPLSVNLAGQASCLGSGTAQLVKEHPLLVLLALRSDIVFVPDASACLQMCKAGRRSNDPSSLAGSTPGTFVYLCPEPRRQRLGCFDPQAFGEHTVAFGSQLIAFSMSGMLPVISHVTMWAAEGRSVSCQSHDTDGLHCYRSHHRRWERRKGIRLLFPMRVASETNVNPGQSWSPEIVSGTFLSSEGVLNGRH